jgi:hypothetical protein
MKNPSSSSSSSSSSSLSLPPPPSMAAAAGQQHHHHQPSSSSYRSGSSGSMGGGGGSAGGTASYAQSLVTSMTIDEMRELHHRAQRDADAKRTELRLVLASRYRELVGSSDQVLHMKARSHELHELLRGVPLLLNKLEASVETQASMQRQHTMNMTTVGQPQGSDQLAFGGASPPMPLRQQLSLLPRLIHRSLDCGNVYMATRLLLDLMALISAKSSTTYPLADALAKRRQDLEKVGAVQALACHDDDNHQEEDGGGDPASSSEATEAQMRMVYFWVQTLPKKIHGRALRILERKGDGGSQRDNAPSSSDDHPSSSPSESDDDDGLLRYGAEVAASSLAALDMLPLPAGAGADAGTSAGSGMALVDTYYSCKSKRLLSLLDVLSSSASASSSSTEEGKDMDGAASNSLLSTGEAEAVLSQIVLLIQYDCILHPYQIFCRRQFPWRDNRDAEVMMGLPAFDVHHVQARCSAFLATHLPLIRSKVQAILGIIAGTTASALGKIRQSLYDITDGTDSMNALNQRGMIGSWNEAVRSMVDPRLVREFGSSGNDGGGGGIGIGPRSSITASSLMGEDRRFSLWSALFSNTFSSLVHSILTSAFASVHTSVVSTLRSSLRSAPNWSHVLPHEAHRNTLHIAANLNASLLKLSADAHELLVHAEERVESERRLRQSLYVQTCEILGRLVCELRCIVMSRSPGSSGGGGGAAKQGGHDDDDNDDDAGATRDLIVGKLCVLLKFRLSSLSKLLDPTASPASMHAASGMISHVDLQSAFDLADDDEDGIVGFDEALEAMEAAFSGTSWRGAQLVRETLLVADDGTSLSKSSSHGSSSPIVPTVTLNELTLLGARGLRHESSGPRSALGVFQESLDDIVDRCFTRWGRTALSPSMGLFEATCVDFMETARSVTDAEWLRLHGAGSTASAVTNHMTSEDAAASVTGVSPHVLSLLLDASSVFNRATCPADFLPPVPSVAYANSLGIHCDSLEGVATLSDRLRSALFRQALDGLTAGLVKHVNASDASSLNKIGLAALAQLCLDLMFVTRLDNARDRVASGSSSSSKEVKGTMSKLNVVQERVQESFHARGGHSSDRAVDLLSEKLMRTTEVCGLYLASIGGESLRSSTSSSIEFDTGSGSSTPLFRAPLRSSTRFVLLPVQADRTLTDVQLRSKYSKSKDASSSSRPEASSGGVMSSGLGFLSSMLKKS